MNDSPAEGLEPDGASGRQCERFQGDAPESERCPAPAQFTIGRHVYFPILVCTAHLGLALLQAPNVLWPPEITRLK
ncbi:hypothetical protein [Streptomyces sp. NPDC058326]|uniref:hypothetical protein n=1 Tax=Streptomyces sp. NPDC058326 TaxID=3346447 RepID=UPI0036E68603